MMAPHWWICSSEFPGPTDDPDSCGPQNISPDCPMERSFISNVKEGRITRRPGSKPHRGVAPGLRSPKKLLARRAHLVTTEEMFL